MFNRNNLPFGARPNAGQAPPPQAPPNQGYDTRMQGGYDTPPRYDVPSARGSAPPVQARGYGGGSGGGRARQMHPVKSPGGNAYAFGNLVAVSPVDFQAPELYLLINRNFVFSARPTQGCNPGEIGLTDAQRTWAGISIGPHDLCEVEEYDPFQKGGQAYVSAIDAELGFAGRKTTDTPYDQDEIGALFTKNFQNQIMAPGQSLIMDHKNIPLRVTIRTVQLGDLSMEKASSDAPTLSDPRARGIVMPHTILNFFKDARSDIKLKGSNRRPAANSIVQPNFKFEDMGIGGLDTEFSAIFRRAFASRIFPPGLVDKLGIQHVRGILLYGPPGTGKTLIARQIGKMLNAREPKIVNGPEVLNKYVGQSEENIRKLFADAEKEYKEKGDESGLHIIIFDELDAVCKQRGSGAGGGTGVGDSVVNQLLSKLDGVDQLNNILLIGMTNRMDMIDEALLRPGRLEVHMEISLPDEHGRAQILKIHTSKMRENDVMDRDVDLEELAKLTKNFSGAEINGLVKAASSFAFSRHIKVGTMAGVSEDVVNMKVKMDDFKNALNEVKPLFGVADEELGRCGANDLINFSENIGKILREGELFTQQIKESSSTAVLSAVLHGPPGSGKTALAARIALDSEFPYIKLVTPEDMVGFSEMQKVQQLDKVFRDAYKSTLSVVVIDNIELLVDWAPIGPRFSNNVLVALKVLLGKKPPKGRKILILATTNERSVLTQLDLFDRFDAPLPVPNVNSQKQLRAILDSNRLFRGANADQVLNRIDYPPSEFSSQQGSEPIVGLGVKKVLTAMETAQQEKEADQKIDRLANLLSTAMQARMLN